MKSAKTAIRFMMTAALQNPLEEDFLLATMSKNSDTKINAIVTNLDML